MAHPLPEQSRWESEITELQTTDPVLGGRGGISNQQALELANRTRHLIDSKIDRTLEMREDKLGLMRETGSYNFTGVININTPFAIPEGDIVVVDLFLTHLPDQTIFTAGDTFNFDGLIIRAAYSNLTFGYILPHNPAAGIVGYTVSAPDMSVAGDQEIIITYRGFSVSYTITINPNLTGIVAGIEIVEMPIVEYNHFDSFSIEGLIVKANYADGTSGILPHDPTGLNGYTYTVPDMFVTGEQSVTISFKDFHLTFTIFVNPILSSIEITQLPITLRFAHFGNFIFDELGVIGNLSDGTMLFLEYDPSGEFGFSIAYPDTTIVGTQTVVVSYRGFQDSYEIEIFPIPLAIEIISFPNNLAFSHFADFNFDGLALVSHYSDRTTVPLNYDPTGEKGFNIIPPDMSIVGYQTIFVSYQGLEAVYLITIIPKVTGIEILSLPYKTTYFINDVFDSNGLKIIASFSNDDTWILDYDSTGLMGYGLSVPNMSIPQSETVTVFFNLKDPFRNPTNDTFLTSFEINILPSIPILDSMTPDEISGSDFTLTGVVVDNGGSEIQSALWEWVSGPIEPIIESPDNLTTIVSGLSEMGSYVFRLTVVNSAGSSHLDVTVNRIPDDDL